MLSVYSRMLFCRRLVGTKRAKFVRLLLAAIVYNHAVDQLHGRLLSLPVVFGRHYQDHWA